jgi:hypothetical protein
VAQHNAWRREAQKREALLEENNSSKNRIMSDIYIYLDVIV